MIDERTWPQLKTREDVIVNINIIKGTNFEVTEVNVISSVRIGAISRVTLKAYYAKSFQYKKYIKIVTQCWNDQVRKY